MAVAESTRARRPASMRPPLLLKARVTSQVCKPSAPSKYQVTLISRHQTQPSLSEKTILALDTTPFFWHQAWLSRSQLSLDITLVPRHRTYLDITLISRPRLSLEHHTYLARYHTYLDITLVPRHHA